MSTASTPRSVEFRRQRERDWNDLDDVVEIALRHGLSRLPASDLERLPALYRSAATSLSVARRTALDRALTAYLESLVTRAYVALYGSRRPAHGVFRQFLWFAFPERVRALWRELFVATLVFGLGLGVAWVLVHSDVEWFYAFVDPALAGGRDPEASTKFLRDTLYAGERSGLTTFSAFLFTHNTQIGFLAFAAGIAAGVPTLLLLFSNGLMLGAFLALFAERGLLVPALGWLLPHGIPEIAAILLCGAAGLHLGRALVLPGALSVRDSLRLAGRSAAVVVMGTVLLFAAAGIIEGVFRQVVVDDRVRLGLTLFNALWLSLWLVLRSAPRARPA